MKNSLLLILMLCCLSCARQPKYKIGVSQCSEDIWRNKQNAELRMGTFLYEDVDMEFASADDKDKVQVAQINRFIDEGVDLLIVSPNQVHAISPAIDRAYDQGIPVILFDRKSDSHKYTAFMGADNQEMGRVIGQFMASQIPATGKILEIKGLKGSSPAQERHEGFLSSLKDSSRLVTCDGDWTQQSGERLMSEMLKRHPDIVCVFGQNDRMAVGAYEAARKQGLEKGIVFMGVDALPGQGGGIEQVRDGVLSASYIYPTRGDLLMQLAMNILEGRPYEKENLLKSALVTRENAEVMLMQAEEMEEQNDRLQTLNTKVNWYLTQYHYQKIYLLLLATIALLGFGWLYYRNYMLRRRHRLEREAFALVVGSQSAPMPLAPAEKEKEQAEEQEVAQDVTAVSQEQREKISADGDMDTNFLDRMRQLVQEQMTDSGFGVETLAGEMGLSRVQLYRRVKQLTGRTPVDIIRLSRLNRAKALLAGGSKTVSEVAYDVGFSSPSYFTKCFKDEFGILPGEVK